MSTFAAACDWQLAANFVGGMKASEPAEGADGEATGEEEATGLVEDAAAAAASPGESVVALRLCPLSDACAVPADVAAAAYLQAGLDPLASS
jgi:hypothetical protein